MQPALEALEKWFSEVDAFCLVAFSGGVDSSLAAYAARRFRGRDGMLAVISASPSVRSDDLDGGRDFCALHDIPLRIIHTDEFSNPDYLANPANRCYFCKQSLYRELRQLAPSQGRWCILNGTNADDLGDYRPGLQAASEFCVRSPLADCGLDKEAVRAVARSCGLDCWNRPASPCLSSRIPYGQAVTVEKVRQIESGESALHALGFDVVRLRHHGTTALIEVPADRIQELEAHLPLIRERLEATGFDSVEIDAEGFVSGKLNRVLEPDGSGRFQLPDAESQAAEHSVQP